MDPNIFSLEWLSKHTLFSVPLLDWGLALLIGVVSFFLMLALLRVAVYQLRARDGEGTTTASAVAAHLLSATNWMLLVAAAAILALNELKFSGRWSPPISHLWFIVLAMQSGLWLNRAVVIYGQRHLPNRNSANIVLMELLTTFIQAMVWVVVVLAILENSGVNITTLVASLGIGGVAIALAIQTILGDLIAAISIAVDKPFQVGDSITAGDISGSIERIGFKSTHLRSPSGEQIVCSNTELLKRTIQNFKRMNQRQVTFRFNLSYRTPIELVEEIPAKVKEIINAQPNAHYERTHFVKLGNAAMEFETAYTVLDADYDRYMDMQQSINLNILRQLAAMEVDLALPDGNRANLAGGTSAHENNDARLPQLQSAR